MTNIFAGKKVRLRAIETEDWPTHFAWNDDSEAARNSYHIPFPESSTAVKTWAENTTKNTGETSDNYHLQIETLDGVLVGSINSHSTNPRAGTFGYGLAILPDHQRKGYATEAVFLLLRYFFHELRYQKCTVQVYSFNASSLKLHERMGFQQEGRLRRMVYTDGQFHDVIYFGITREEFEDLHIKHANDDTSSADAEAE